jgi:hypothetical protein
MIAASAEMTQYILTFICLPAATLAAWCVFVVVCFHMMSHDLHDAIGLGSTNDIKFVVDSNARTQAFGLNEPDAEVGLVKQLEFPAMGQLAQPL